MDLPLPISVAIIVFLILMAAFFSAAETALTAVSRAIIHQLEHEGVARAATVKRLRNHKEEFISAILFGNNLVNILASALTTDIMVRIFPGAGVLYATAILTVVLIIFAEILPKTYAIQHATPSALAVAPIVEVFTRLMAPIIRAVQVLVRFALRLLGPRKPTHPLSATQALRGAIDIMASESGDVRRARAMLYSILELEEITVGEIMIPRGDLTAIDAGLPVDEIVRQVREQPHTQIGRAHV